MNYIKNNTKQYTSVPRGYRQKFFRPVGSTVNKNNLMTLMVEDEITDLDIQILMFIYNVKFCTTEQVIRYAHGLGEEYAEQRIEFLYSIGCINKFIMTDVEGKKLDIPGDAKIYYCLHDGGKMILTQYGDSYISWDFANNCVGSVLLSKYLINTELYLEMLYNCNLELVYFNSNPEFVSRTKWFNTSAHYCYKNQDGGMIYTVVETVNKNENIVSVREKIRHIESIFTTNIWRKYYPDTAQAPMLFIVTDTEEGCLQLAREIASTTKIKNVRYTTDARIIRGVSNKGAFAKYVENDEGGYLEDTMMKMFAK